MTGSLGHLAAVVTLDIDPFKQSSNALNATIRATGAALTAQERAVKAFGGSLNNMKAVYSSMQQQANNYNAKLETQKAKYDELISKTAATAEEQKKLTARQANATAAFNRTQAQATKLAGEMHRLGLQIDQQDSKWYKAGKAAGTFGNAAISASHKLNGIGNTMTTHVTAPVVAGFGYAARSAINFNSEIDKIGPLLSNNGKITRSVRKELDQMANASKRWATEYGISTSKINAGLEELVKRGYSAQQAMGAMPSILAAAKASGDDFNDVMKVSTSTLEQFGLKSNTTAGMLKNTRRVTDSLTYTANATAAGFQDMGDAMTYVGPTAHAAGLSLEETASAIGLMSNQGIEGSVAGTALRSALTRLMKPTKQNIAGFKELGINVAAFKKHTLTLPEILNQVKNNTRGWTKEQRAAAIAMAFGTEAQAGMNALVSEGGDALSDLTEKTEKANGSTQKIADTMNNTAAAKIDRFKESLHVLAINMGENLVPAIMPLVKDMTVMVKKFGELDSATQKNIVKWLALAAVIGPATKLLGSGVGVIGGLGKAFSGTALTISRFNAASKNGAKGFKLLHASLSQTAFNLGKFGKSAEIAKGSTTALATGAVSAEKAMESTAGASTAAATGIGLLPAAIAGVTLAAGVGVAAWATYNTTLDRSKERTRRWGSDVGSYADKALTKFKNFNGQASAELNSFAKSSTGDGKKAAEAFKNMGDQIEKTGNDINGKLKNVLKDLPASVRDVSEKSVNEQVKANNKTISNAKKLSNNVAGILKSHNGNMNKLTAEQHTYVLNAQRKLGDDEVKILGISNSKKKNVLKALNGDVKNLTKQQAQDVENQITNALEQEQRAYIKNADKIKNLYKDGLISKKQYNKMMSALDKDHATKVNDNLGVISGLEKQYGTEHGYRLNEILKLNKTTWGQVGSLLDKHKDKLSSVAKTYGNVSQSAKKAGDMWNSIVLDPKTGEIKTNSQEALNEMAKTGQGWEKLKFMGKHAKIDSNAKSMIAEAAIQSGRWKDLPWEDKKALLAIEGKGKKEMQEMIEGINDWDKLSPKQQTAIVHAKGRKELAEALISANEWNKLTPKQQNFLVKSQGSRDLVDLLTKLGKWNSISPKAQKAVIEGKGSAEVADMLIQMGQWNNLTPEEKELIVGGNVESQIVNDMVQIGMWNQLTVDEKKAVVRDQATANLVFAMKKTGEWDKLPIQDKNAIIHDKASATIINALNKVDKWNGIDPIAHDAIINDKFTAPIIAAMIKNGEWNNLKYEDKQAIVNTGNSPINLANLITAYGSFNDLPDAKKNLIIDDAPARQKLKDAGILISQYNTNTFIETKALSANDQDLIDKLQTGHQAIVVWNKHQVVVKKMNGNNVQLMDTINGSRTAVDEYNKKNPNRKDFTGDSSSVETASGRSQKAIKVHNDYMVDLKHFTGDPGSILDASLKSQKAIKVHNEYHVDTKKLPGDPTSVMTASNNGRTAIGSYNKKTPVTHHLKALDKASNIAWIALGALGKWNAFVPAVHVLTTIVKKITGHARGTNDFEGGPTYVNDESGSTFRELIRVPSGEMFIPHGRNVLLNLPRHSEIVPARQTQKLINIPQYAKGTPKFSHAIAEISKLPTSTNNSSVVNTNTDNSITINAINVTVSGDGGSQQIGRQVAESVQAEIRKLLNSDTAAMGGGNYY